MANNITLPPTGTGDATPKVATTQLGGGEHVQHMQVVDPTGANTAAVNASGEQSVKLADGSNVSQGALADAAWSGSGNGGVIGILKAIYNKLVGALTANPGTGQGKTLLFALIDTNTAGDNTIVAAAPGLKTKVVSYVFTVGGVVAVRWKSGATSLSGAMPFAANGGIGVPGEPSAHLLETAVNTALVLNLSAAQGVRGHISYFQEA